MKVRNMIALHAWKRKSGAHGKTTKAMRRKEKVELLREYSSIGRSQHPAFNRKVPSSSLGAPTSNLEHFQMQFCI